MNSRTTKGTAVPKSDLTPYSVGLQRLRDINLKTSDFTPAQIDTIGTRSMHRLKTVIGKCCGRWCVYNPSSRMPQATFVAYYTIVGRKITSLRLEKCQTLTDELHLMESRKPCKQLRDLTADEIFTAVKGRRPARKHATKPSVRTRIAYSARMEKLTF